MIGLKTKTIKSVLRNRTNAWLESLPDDMRARVKADTIVTGGCIASMLLGEPVNDIDIYFRTQATAKLVADHYVKEFVTARKARIGIDIPIYVEELKDVRGEPRVRIVIKSAGVESDKKVGSEYAYFEARPPEEAGDYIGEVYDDPATIADLSEETKEAVAEQEPEKEFRPVFLSSNAITLSRKIQIIIRFFGSPDEIHENYDFVHCMNYWDAATGELGLRPRALESLLSRSLVYNGSRYPVASLFRIRKFIERGWRINAGQIVKMALQISGLDLTRFDVLEDQLTGVDVAYFQQVLDTAKERGADKIESAYLIEIINRMFD